MEEIQLPIENCLKASEGEMKITLCLIIEFETIPCLLAKLFSNKRLFS